MTQYGFDHQGDGATYIRRVRRKRVIPILFFPGIMGTRLQTPGGAVMWDPDNTRSVLRLARLNATDTRNLLGVSQVPHAQLMMDNRAGYIDHLVNSTIGKLFQTVYSGAYAPALMALEHAFQPDFYAAGSSGNPNLYSLRPSGCENKECPVYVCGYDWRKQVYSDGRTDIVADIRNRILGANGIESKVRSLYNNSTDYSISGKYIIVTHSMGGIVSREFLRRNPSFAQQVKAVIHVVQPAAGSPKMYATMKCGAAAMSPWFPIDEQVIASIVGRSAEDAQTFLSDIPGGLALAPNTDYDKYFTGAKPSWINWDEAVKTRLRAANSPIINKSQSLNIYDLYAENSGNLGMVNGNFRDRWRNIFLEHLIQVKAFHGVLRVYSHPATTEVCSNGRSTCTGVSIREETIRLPMPVGASMYGTIPPVPLSYQVVVSRDVRTNTGDGTVPLPSQNILLRGSSRQHTHCTVFNQIEHGGVFANRAVINEVIRRIGAVLQTV